MYVCMSIYIYIYRSPVRFSYAFAFLRVCVRVCVFSRGSPGDPVGCGPLRKTVKKVAALVAPRDLVTLMRCKRAGSVSCPPSRTVAPSGRAPGITMEPAELLNRKRYKDGAGGQPSPKPPKKACRAGRGQAVAPAAPNFSAAARNQRHLRPPSARPGRGCRRGPGKA